MSILPGKSGNFCFPRQTYIHDMSSKPMPDSIGLDVEIFTKLRSCTMGEYTDEYTGRIVVGADVISYHAGNPKRDVTIHRQRSQPQQMAQTGASGIG